MELIGIDTGGTFTDFVALGPLGRRALKRLSTPRDPARALLDGLRELGVAKGGATLVHGTTVATNAVLERGGGPAALVVNEGFEDLLLIGRQAREGLYEPGVARVEPLVPRSRCLGLAERTEADGSVSRPVREGEIARLVGRLRRTGARSVAVSLLHSYANPASERAVARALRGAGMTVSVSHEVLPQFREYERASTTALNAYLAPVLSDYLGRLERGPSATGLRVMLSSGGVARPELVRRFPVQTVLSGPAGGVVGAARAAAALGARRVITLDMGGTSTDVAAVDGEPELTGEGRLAGLPVGIPLVAVHTVG
ncbi:MAG: hydantoinase/oxoprolinase family protein, partial [Planctomycetes bacterium]|nr:hydantoinase/oxoprolinase family protein [Planctomycetota bacterium]